MSIEATFLVGAATAMGIVLAVIWYLRKPLQAILSELCGKRARAVLVGIFTRDAVSDSAHRGTEPRPRTSLPAIGCVCNLRRD